MVRSNLLQRLAHRFAAVLVFTLMLPLHATAEHLDDLTILLDTTEVSSEPPSVIRSISIRTQEELALGIDLDTVSAQPYDAGRLWSLQELPEAYLAQRYDMQVDEEWTRILQRASARLDNCTGNYVSPSGLMLTSYTCVSTYLEDAGHTDAFYARELATEEQISGMYVEHLVEVVDVTSEVDSALAVVDATQNKKEALARVKLSIENRLIQAHAAPHASVRAEVLPHVRGDGYVAHVYNRLDDVRLVWAPEKQVGLYGGTIDRYSYPRFSPSVAVFRVFQENEPIHPQAHYLVNPEGTLINEAVLAVGHPQPAQRHLTVSQIVFARDVTAPSLQLILIRQAEVLQDAGFENAAIQATLAAERHAGLQRALEDPYILARKADAEEQLTNAEPEVSEIVARLREIQQEKRAVHDAYAALALPDERAVGSPTFERLVHLIRHAAIDGQFVDSEALRWELSLIDDKSAELDKQLLATRLEHLSNFSGGSGGSLHALLLSQSSQEWANDLISNSVLASKEATQEMIATGSFAAADPAEDLYEAIQERFAEYALEANSWSAEEHVLLSDLRQHRHANHPFGQALSAEADGSLRLADGRVQRYPYNGTIAPAFTSISGLFNQHYSFEKRDWALPERWLEVSGDLRRHIPLNLVSSSDPGSGMDGAALLNADQELVGVAYDINVESLASPIMFDPERMRTVSVDIRGIFETLHTVYGADRVVSEMLDGVLVERHEDADIPSPTQ